MKVDIHQHVWTPPLLEALAARECLPFVRRTDGLTVLHCGGAALCGRQPRPSRTSRRADLLSADGVDRAIVAISSPIGIETLPLTSAA